MSSAPPQGGAAQTTLHPLPNTVSPGEPHGPTPWGSHRPRCRKHWSPSIKKSEPYPREELPNPLTTEAPGKQLRPLHVTRITTTTSPRVHESYWTPAPTTTTTASRRRQSQVTRIICLGRPRHHRQFGDPGQQTPTTSAHPGDTGTTLRQAHVPSSFRSHRTHSDSAESMAASLNNTYHYLFQQQEIPQKPPGSFATGIIDAHAEVDELWQQSPEASAHPGYTMTPLRTSA